MTEVRMPQMGLTMTEGTILCWHKKAGERVEKGDVLAEIETDKISSELEADSEGILLKIYVDEGETAPVQALLAVIGTGGELEKDQVHSEGGKEMKDEKRIRISPLAKRTANELQVDYAEVSGSGPAGRILQKDILDARTQQKEYSQKSEKNIGGKQKEEKAPEKTVEESRGVPLCGVRKVIAERMSEAHRDVPSVTLIVKADVTELARLREEINEERQERISWNDCILKITAGVLDADKTIIRSLQEGKIVEADRVCLAVAVAAPSGLVVPVIKDAQRLSLTMLAREAKKLAMKAREGRLELDELEGSNFTVTNLGMYGVEAFTPIINLPNSAILGVGAVEEELVLAEGKVKARKIVRLSLSFDHRLHDGDTAARFAGQLKDGLEHPKKWIL